MQAEADDGGTEYQRSIHKTPQIRRVLAMGEEHWNQRIHHDKENEKRLGCREVFGLIPLVTPQAADTEGEEEPQ